MFQEHMYIFIHVIKSAYIERPLTARGGGSWPSRMRPLRMQVFSRAPISTLWGGGGGRGGGKKEEEAISPFWTPADTKTLVLLSASVERFGVTRMRDLFSYILYLTNNIFIRDPFFG